MNRYNMYDLHHHLAENTDDLNADFPSKIAAAERVLDILRQPRWTQAEKHAKCVELHTQFDSWYKSGPFSSQKWSTATTAIACQPLVPREKIFYTDIESYIRSCIWRLEKQDTSVNNHVTDDPEYPVGHMPIFCDLVRLIMGTVDGTPLPREYLALTTVNAGILYRLNPVKTALQRDGVWVQLLKDMVAYVRCAEKEAEDIQGGFNPRDTACNLTKMTVSVEESILALKTEYDNLLEMIRELQVNAGLTIARHRHSQVEPQVEPHTDVLMHRLFRLTHG